MKDEVLQIRKAAADDLTDVQHCARSAYAKYIDRMKKPPAPMHADFAHQIAEGHVYVAMYERLFSGYVVFYAEGDHLQLENIAVLPEKSGKGIGRSLTEYVEHAARKAGMNAVELYTNEAMTENLEMYPKFGYAETERKQQDGFNRVFFRKDV